MRTIKIFASIDNGNRLRLACLLAVLGTCFAYWRSLSEDQRFSTRIRAYEQAVPVTRKRMLAKFMKARNDNPELWGRYVDALRERSDITIPILEEFIRGSDQDMAEEALSVLLNFRERGESALPLLLHGLKDKEEGRRGSAANCAVYIRPETILIILEGLKDKHSGVTLHIADTASMGLSYDDRTAPIIPKLVRLLHDPSREVRMGAIMALGQSGASEAAAVLAPFLTNQDIGIREAAADALWVVNNSTNSSEMEAILGSYYKERVPGLIKNLSDPSLEVRHDAAMAFWKMGSYAEPALPALRTALKDKERIVRRAAADALERIGTAEAAEAIENAKLARRLVYGLEKPFIERPLRIWGVVTILLALLWGGLRARRRGRRILFWPFLLTLWAWTEFAVLETQSAGKGFDLRLDLLFMAPFLAGSTILGFLPFAASWAWSLFWRPTPSSSIITKPLLSRAETGFFSPPATRTLAASSITVALLSNALILSPLPQTAFWAGGFWVALSLLASASGGWSPRVLRIWIFYPIALNPILIFASYWIMENTLLF